MPTSFHDRVKSALADENLQKALDGNAERRIQARLTAYASLVDPEGMRQRAHAARAEVIAHLDQYLEQFVTQVEAHGISVHRAADSAQAVQIVLEIARHSSGGKPVTIAKSKTMVSEEIHLNKAFEAAGMHPVETDLGEYIVQLRAEPPSHIITPAVHLTRQQVGRLFQEKLGVPYTEEISEMTDTARRTLRQVFLEAEIGLSGVNFGVAESGTLVLMTNEGNGRMVTTLPPVHIALMGMERLVPTLDDLDLMMALLPRSGTGQKITVYANLIHSPRRPGEVDGALERHLVVVDNGRSAVRQSPLSEVLYCIRCGACLNACPVFREIGGHAYVGKGGEYSIYPGPLGSVLSAGLFGACEFGHLARASSLCGACKEACPVDIDLPKLLLRVRAGMTTPHKPPSPYPFPLKGEGKKSRNLDDVGREATYRNQISRNFPHKKAMPNAPAYLKAGIRLFSLAAVYPRLFGMAQRLAGWGARLVSPRSAWMHLPAVTGWGFNKDMPRPAVKPFHARWEKGLLPFPSLRLGQAASFRADASARTDLSPREEGFREETGLASSPGSACDHERTPFAPLPSSPLSRFTEELEALGGTVTVCRENELGGRILGLLAERGIHAVAAWDGENLPTGLLEVLQHEGIRVCHNPDPALRVGITGALAAVAETGTLVIPGGVGRPLTASLLPEIHVAVLRGGDIYENLSQVLNLREVREASCVALVSGPSRTADIEMTLTIGVHGPGEVHVFCVS